MVENELSGDFPGQSGAGGFAVLEQCAHVKRATFAMNHDVQHYIPHLGELCGLLGPFGRPSFPVEHVGACYVMFAGAHQGQLNLILNVLDMNSAAIRQATSQGERTTVSVS